MYVPQLPEAAGLEYHAIGRQTEATRRGRENETPR
jgi:hypothetical protein